MKIKLSGLILPFFLCAFVGSTGCMNTAQRDNKPQKQSPQLTRIKKETQRTFGLFLKIDQLKKGKEKVLVIEVKSS